jgi:hypothetical protein
MIAKSSATIFSYTIMTISGSSLRVYSTYALDCGTLSVLCLCYNSIESMSKLSHDVSVISLAFRQLDLSYCISWAAFLQGIAQYIARRLQLNFVKTWTNISLTAFQVTSKIVAKKFGSLPQSLSMSLGKVFQAYNLANKTFWTFSAHSSAQVLRARPPIIW